MPTPTTVWRSEHGIFGETVDVYAVHRELVRACEELKPKARAVLEQIQAERARE